MPKDHNSTSITFQKILCAITPSLLLGLNLLIFGTFVVFSENRGEFLISYTDALTAYYLPGLAFFTGLGLLSMNFGQRARQIFNSVVIFLGVISYIHGNLLLWDTGVLDGNQLDFTESWRSIVDVVLWVSLAWSIYRYRNWLITHGWKICATLILFQTIGLLSVWNENRGESAPNLATFPKQLEVFSTETNVIHIILDGFQTNIFEQLMAENPTIPDDFSGFTLFRDATTSSDVTYLSVPASLSGQVYKNQVTISEYHEQTLNGDNLYSFLASRNFEVDVATPLWWLESNTTHSSYYRIPSPYADMRETLLSTTLLLGDISLFRQVPHFLKPLIYGSGAWMLSGKLVSKPEQQFEHFAHSAFVTDLQNRMSVSSTKPKYKFIHVVSPHAPFVSSPDCKFTGAELEYTNEAFSQQSFCTLQTITAFLDQLKKMGVYDKSLLIIHGDHGGGVPFEMYEKNGSKTSSFDALHRVWGNPLPLVLIKPISASGPLKISNKQVQLPDIPVTVAQQLGFESDFPGESMFEENDGSEYERVYFHSKVHRNKAMSMDYFHEFTGYRITGSVYQVASWQKTASYEMPTTNDEGLYQWGTPISFGRNGNFRSLQNGGWIVTANKDVTWTEGPKSGLSIGFPETTGDIKMIAKIKPLLAPGKVDRQRAFIFVGEEKIGEWLVSINKFQFVEINIPHKLILPSGKTEISFSLPDAQPPNKLGIGTDKRVLALAFMSVQFEQMPSVPPAGQQ